jgi:ABC-type transport system involved in multi-copper enzyme maturation permease subunit
LSFSLSKSINSIVDNENDAEVRVRLRTRARSLVEEGISVSLVSQTALPPATIVRPDGRSLHPLPHLLRGVWIQTFRRREIYVGAILLGLYALAALVLRIVGIESPQVARFVAGLGLQLAALLAALLVIVMGVRSVAEELEQRTIYPILAKPVARWQFLAGKALPTFTIGVLALAVFTLTTLVIAPRLPYQQTAVLAQALALQSLALAMLTALVIWFSLRLPAGVAMLLAAALNFFGAWLANFLANRGGAGRLFASLIPDFALFGQFQRYVDGGGALPPGLFLGLALYALAWTALFAGLAHSRFQRMPL